MFDEILIERCRGGDLKEFRKLVKESAPLVFSIAFRITGNEETGKDITQEVMITLWQKISTLKDQSRFKTWLCRTTVNRCYDFLRKEKLKKEIRPDEIMWKRISEKVEGHDSTTFDNLECAMILDRLTEELSPKQKSIFVLSELEDFSHDEISEITGMNKANIKANLHHARKQLSEAVKKYL